MQVDVSPRAEEWSVFAKYLEGKIASIFCIICMSCANGTKVTSNDLLGTWVLAESSRPDLRPSFQEASSRIVLNANGDFSATQLPGDLLYVPPEKRVRLITGTGSWKLSTEAGERRIYLE